MKIYIACPNIGEIHSALSQRLLEIIALNRQHEYIFNFRIGQPISSQRNTIVNDFLTTDADVLWFIDSDMLPPENILDILLKEYDSSVGVVAPVTFIMQNTIKYNLFMFNEDKTGHTNKKIERGGLNRVDACGMGCVFIFKRVFETTSSPWFDFVLNERGETIETETFYFYKKIHNIHTVYVDSEYVCGHIKQLNLAVVDMLNRDFYLQGVKQNEKNCSCNGHKARNN